MCLESHTNTNTNANANTNTDTNTNTNTGLLIPHMLLLLLLTMCLLGVSEEVADAGKRFYYRLLRDICVKEEQRLKRSNFGPLLKDAQMHRALLAFCFEVCTQSQHTLCSEVHTQSQHTHRRSRRTQKNHLIDSELVVSFMRLFHCRQ